MCATSAWLGVYDAPTGCPYCRIATLAARADGRFLWESASISPMRNCGESWRESTRTRSDPSEPGDLRWLIVPDGDVKLIFPIRRSPISCRIGQAGDGVHPPARADCLWDADPTGWVCRSPMASTPSASSFGQTRHIDFSAYPISNRSAQCNLLNVAKILFDRWGVVRLLERS